MNHPLHSKVWCGLSLSIAVALGYLFFSAGQSPFVQAQITVQRTPSTDQWFLERVGAPAISTQRSAPVLVAVIDDGVDRDEPQLKDQIAGVINIVAPDPMRDHSGHGTHTAAIIAARPGVTGIRGVCIECRLIIIKAITNHGYGSDVTVARAIDLAVERGARVLNLSIGGTADTPAIRRAIARAIAQDIVVVAAAGNQTDTERPFYPAAYPGVIAVGAIDRFNHHAHFASSGAYIDIVAPGVDIVSLDSSPRGYSSMQGTSTAAPQVSAAAGLLRAQFPHESAARIRTALLVSATDLGPRGHDHRYGAGLLNITSAISYLRQQRVRAIAR